MKVLFLTLTCCALSQATVFRWLGSNNAEENATEEPTPSEILPAAPVPPLPLYFEVPDFARQFFDLYYLNSPEVSAGASPLSFLNAVEPRRPLIQTPFVIRPAVSQTGGQVNPIIPPHYMVPVILQNTPQGFPQPLNGGLRIEQVNQVPIPSRTPFNPNTQGPIVDNLAISNPGSFNSQHLNVHNFGQANEVRPPLAVTSRPFEFPTNQQLPYTGGAVFDRSEYEQSAPLPLFNGNDASLVESSQAYSSLEGTNEALQGDQNNRVIQHSYTQGDGTRVSEKTNVVTSEDGTELVKSGEYEYIAQNGTIVTVKWIADNNGFRIVS